jgi:flavin reductase (DIM6/NTAB) family NADH-FMN oxidoreductase RutF
VIFFYDIVPQPIYTEESMTKRQLGPCITFFPQPMTLISTVSASGENDLMAASWVSLVSKTPPTLSISLQHERQTYANILATGSFVVNVMPVHLVEQADYCGLISGRQADKATIAGLRLLPAKHGAAPLLDDAPLNVECRLSGEMAIGDYRLLLGEILEIHVDAAAFGADGSIDAAALDPLVYLGGLRQYWSLGKKVAPAYQAGRRFLPQ